MSETIGYARVSTARQNLDAQTDALKQVGCTRIFTDKDRGVQSSRPGWDELLAYIRHGDVLVVTELSRMTRSLLHLLDIVQMLETRQVELKSLRENIDTSTATGRGFLSIMGVIAQMEREIKARAHA
ncbi:MAG: recombinase family protein [Gammaproteobacteria bacterium]|nr:recombinase family protein [Gammaproteobacteria bacterium]